MGEALLVALIERILCVGAEFTIIWRIKKDKVVSAGCVFPKESLKVHVLNDGVSKVLLYLWRLQKRNLPCQIFSVVRDPSVGNIELASAVVTEHRSVGILPHKKKDSSRCTGRDSIRIDTVIEVP